jgi:hypothetical protein
VNVCNHENSPKSPSRQSLFSRRGELAPILWPPNGGCSATTKVKAMSFQDLPPITSSVKEEKPPHPRSGRKGSRFAESRRPINGNDRARIITRTSRKTRKEKVFRKKPGIPLDGNAKARIYAYAKAYNAKNRKEGQHRGPITWAFFRVLRTILWGFHNEHTGHCFPSYESIADKAQCHRDTVYEAIHALEESGILDWVHRFDKIYQDGWKVIRTSNAYLFRDPLPCATSSETYKSENPAGTLPNQEKILTTTPKTNIQDLEHSLVATLISLGRTIGAIAA